MPAETTLAEYIRSREEVLRRICDFPVGSAKSLIDIAKDISEKEGLKRFGTNFKIPKQLKESPHLNVEFNPFLAEPLLREGSLLLQRCLQQRTEYEELRTKSFEACVQIDEMLRLNLITEEEEKEYYLSVDIAKSEVDAIKKEIEQLELVSNTITRSIDALSEKEITELADIQRVYDASVAGNTNVISDNNVSAEKRRANWTKNSLATQQSQNASQLETNRVKMIAAQKNLELKTSQAKFQRARNDVARLVALRRAEQLVLHLGALNFKERMVPILARLDNDLSAAWLRLDAASTGFQMLYGDEYPRDTFPPTEVGFDFDELVTWCQNTNTWLASFLDKQQQVTRSFGLRNMLGLEKFNAGAMLSKWSFKLTDEDFYNSKFVRMRAFSVQVDSGQLVGSWNVKITPPPVAKKHPKSPDPMGTLFLGRVTERTYAVVSEGSAPPKLYNASPMGDWIIEVSNGTLGVAASGILDIDIHLTVALV